MIFEKIDIRGIIKDHIKTLKDERTQETSVVEVLIFLIIPFAISGALVYKNYLLSDSMINILIASLSIFVGLLLNLLVLLISMIDKLKDKIKSYSNPGIDSKNDFFSLDKVMLEKRYSLLDETYCNISFGILLSLVSIPLLIIALIKNEIVKSLTNFIGYILLIMFLITLMMILKRIHVLFSEELKIK